MSTIATDSDINATLGKAVTGSVDAATASLCGFIKQYDRAVVAFSGGLDSSLVLWATVSAIGAENTLAVTSASPALPGADREELGGILAQIGLNDSQHRFIYTREMEVAGYYENSPKRCYFCKTELYADLRALKESEYFSVVFDGCNVSDLSDIRPGQQAAKEQGVVSPLLECGIDKPTARAIARSQGLSFAEKPASACLSSRIPHGVRITDEVLAQVDRAELALKRLGFAGHRVRYHNEVARLELQNDDFERFMDAKTRKTVSDAIKSAGFRFVTIDLEGYRMGSLNVENGEKEK